MRRISLFLLLFLSLFEAPAQTQKDIDREELKNLLEERKLKFDSYSVSLEKRSGIFGNKTKNDIKNSSQVLIDIVKTDNRIISTLYRVVDFRTYEKVNMNYDLKKIDEPLTNLKHAADTLSKQVEALKNTNHDLQSNSTRLKWLLYILSFLIILVTINRWRKNIRSSQN